MIPLRIRAEVSGADEPFVVRLCAASSVGSRHDARLSSGRGDVTEYTSRYGLLRLFGLEPESAEGDVRWSQEFGQGVKLDSCTHG